jgi:hypothetical protein
VATLAITVSRQMLTDTPANRWRNAASSSGGKVRNCSG